MNRKLKSVTLEYELLKLDSWYKALEVVDKFFDSALYDESNKELKCEEMVKNYYAIEKIFTLFHKDYGAILEVIYNFKVKESSFEKNIVNLNGDNEDGK
ncbi:hypothetical protein ACFFIF_11025 [Vagococcus entomophilus]|uniref:Uncharacterized protein n=1 Tax=Vagococcus entomophilus TaxID=1160095 RepID=A0A430AF61_9ENTE|nr:hypothetical protein [Vagococcus entomophilus]RSU06217.1 hypothetical protein CBF30_10915 [Vagococcus entomophilus]